MAKEEILNLFELNIPNRIQGYIFSTNASNDPLRYKYYILLVYPNNLPTINDLPNAVETLRKYHLNIHRIDESSNKFDEFSKIKELAEKNTEYQRKISQANENNLYTLKHHYVKL